MEPATTTLHGVLLDVFGIGVLLLGESGTGKSECALELISRGHRLVADDVVEVWRAGEREVLGRAPAAIRHHMEIRGLGIINVQELFGVAAVRPRKRVELVVQLEAWQPGAVYERLGLGEQTTTVLGVSVALVCIPVSAGRSIAILVEVAARNELCKRMGIHGARNLIARLTPEPAPMASENDPDADQAA
jgi:HPr kinase/phosphorylase